METDILQTILQNVPISNFKFIAKWHYWDHYARIQRLKNSKEDNTDSGNGLLPASMFYKSIRIQEILSNFTRVNHLLREFNFLSVPSLEMFQYAPLDAEERQLLLKATETRPTSGPCIVDHATFLRNFDAFTDGAFRDFDWTLTTVFGGAIEACLRPVPPEHSTNFESLRDFYAKKYPNSDIDIMTLYANSLLRHLKQKSPAFVVGTKSNVNIVLQYPKRNIQCVSLAPARDIEDILISADIDCSGVAFDGKKVLMTHRAFIAFTHGFNIAAPEARRIRGHTKYEQRLLKYQQRGYSVVDFNIGAYSNEIAKFKQGIVHQKEQIIEKAKQDFHQLCKEYSGITLLLLFEVFPELYSYMTPPEGTIPWSPDHTVESITQRFRNDSRFQEAVASYSGYYGEPEIDRCTEMWTASQDNELQSDILSLKVTGVQFEKALSPRSNWYESLLLWCSEHQV
eukprot:CAMPEP_0168548642 /NCGR_PEP_ID=MMETSP0413-20121227/4676_1 /TAXON_ID=136452 /ORGANISM="Filamoeba nolandi, Strain NC-AS-23-1" /LENGTH=453 /DNA_ID=CAMNT_0008578971 /DNA_START=81 /DNA_END=1443 /DNA_ORIENTATION=-